MSITAFTPAELQKVAILKELQGNGMDIHVKPLVLEGEIGYSVAQSGLDGISNELRGLASCGHLASVQVIVEDIDGARSVLSNKTMGDDAALIKAMLAAESFTIAVKVTPEGRKALQEMSGGLKAPEIWPIQKLLSSFTALEPCVALMMGDIYKVIIPPLAEPPARPALAPLPLPPASRAAPRRVQNIPVGEPDTQGGLLCELIKERAKTPGKENLLCANGNISMLAVAKLIHQQNVRPVQVDSIYHQVKQWLRNERSLGKNPQDFTLVMRALEATPVQAEAIKTAGDALQAPQLGNMHLNNTENSKAAAVQASREQAKNSKVRSA
jgi:hypothetical protein